MPIVGIGAMLGTIALMWTSGVTGAGARNPFAMILPVTAPRPASGCSCGAVPVEDWRS